MALYGQMRDISMFRFVNRELMQRIISQQVVFYKYNITKTQVNMYGEASTGRYFADPVILFALVERGSPASPVSDLGVDYTYPLTVRFLRDDLISKYNSANQGQGFGPFQAQPIQYGASIQPAVGCSRCVVHSSPCWRCIPNGKERGRRDNICVGQIIKRYCYRQFKDG